MILTNQTKIKISFRKVQKIVQKILRILSIPHANLDVSFVGNTTIRKLNKKFRRIDRSTDVLSFPILTSREAREGKSFLGDLVISLPTVKRQAKEYRKTFKEELYFLIVHGILHLLGYDHEKSKSQARAMRRLEKKILGRI